MKANGSNPISKALMLLLVASVSVMTAISQPDYKFTSRTLVAGTNLQIGAVYSFLNVKTGVDARVTITNITGGISLTDIDGSGGFADALQPVLTVPGLANGYVEFRIDFYHSGTLNPAVQVEIPITPIDVDGQKYSGMPLYEFDEVENTTGYTMYQFVGGQLNMTVSGSWVRGKNTAAVDYPGIDTAQKGVMFTSVNAGISSLNVRVGADNRSNTSASRLRSFYFKKFVYPHGGILENGSVASFTGTARDNRVDLRYEINEPSKVKEVIAEKAGTDMQFKAFQTIAATEGQTLYNLNDTYTDGTSFYRLKLVSHTGEINYSNTLRFEKKGSMKAAFKVFPSAVNDQATVMFESAGNEAVCIQIVDYNGRVVYNQYATAQKGSNNLSVTGLGNLSSGNYIVLARSGKEVVQQKIVKL
jgi:hypothetical protein